MGWQSIGLCHASIPRNPKLLPSAVYFGRIPVDAFLHDRFILFPSGKLRMIAEPASMFLFNQAGILARSLALPNFD